MKEAKAGSKKKAAGKPATKTTSAETKKSASSEPKSPAQPPTAAAGSAPQAPVVDLQPQLPATHGKLGVFGGPKDRGIKPEDKLALPTGPHGVYERIRSLNPKSFYCAMRWNYHVEHLTPEEVKRWWANKKLLVTNPKNDSAAIVRAVDYGPHEKTGLDIGISPGAAETLGVEVGDEVDIALADPKSPLGPVQ
jgi:hypothetical protein